MFILLKQLQYTKRHQGIEKFNITLTRIGTMRNVLAPRADTQICIFQKRQTLSHTVTD